MHLDIVCAEAHHTYIEVMDMATHSHKFVAVSGSKFRHLEHCSVCGAENPNQPIVEAPTVGAALQRNLDEAIALNSAWLILRSLHDEALRQYDLPTAMQLLRASSYVGIEN